MSKCGNILSMNILIRIKYKAKYIITTEFSSYNMIIIPSILPGIGIVISEEGLRGSSLTLCRKSSHASFSSSDGISIEICNIRYRAIGGSVFDYKNKGRLKCVTIER